MPTFTPEQIEALRRDAEEARAAADAAVKAQWTAYETGGLPAFGPAHVAARAACARALAATQALYDSGAEHTPYWHVTPRQMAAYARHAQ